MLLTNSHLYWESAVVEIPGQGTLQCLLLKSLHSDVETGVCTNVVPLFASMLALV